jgi:hypothetical protein
MEELEIWGMGDNFEGSHQWSAPCVTTKALTLLMPVTLLHFIMLEHKNIGS